MEKIVDKMSCSSNNSSHQSVDFETTSHVEPHVSNFDFVYNNVYASSTSQNSSGVVQQPSVIRTVLRSPLESITSESSTNVISEALANSFLAEVHDDSIFKSLELDQLESNIVCGISHNQSTSHSLLNPHEVTQPCRTIPKGIEVIGLPTNLINVTLENASTNHQQANRFSICRESNYIYQLLHSTPEGRWLLNCWKVERDPKTQSKIRAAGIPLQFCLKRVARLIVLDEIYRTKCFVIPADRLDQLADLSVICFPNHIKDTFYSRSSDGKNSNGLLFNVSTKLRAKARIYGFHETPNPTPKRIETNDSYNLDNFEALKYLIQRLEPEYLNLWLTTGFDDKLQCYKHNNIPTILRILPNIAQPFGLELLVADYLIFYGKDTHLLKSKWPLLAQKIKKVVNDEKKKDDEIQEVLKLCMSADIRKKFEDDEEERKKDKKRRTLLKIEDKDNTDLLGLILLPTLFPKVNKASPRVGCWHPTKKEVQNTFLYYKELKEGDSIQEALGIVEANLREMHAAHKFILYPYAVIFGESLSSIKYSFVVIENIVYRANSPLEAVDLVFKSTKALHKEFSKYCNHVWDFVQSEIYAFPIATMGRTVSKFVDKVRNTVVSMPVAIENPSNNIDTCQQ